MRIPLTSTTFEDLKKTVVSFLTRGRSESYSFERVLGHELAVVEELRKRVPGYKQKFQGATSFQKAHDGELLGLAFSGGGIRSATFNLGVLQALAKLNMLHCFDYLSTVSGGGYIGSWLAAWTCRAGGIRKVEQALD